MTIWIHRKGRWVPINQWRETVLLWLFTLCLQCNFIDLYVLAYPFGHWTSICRMKGFFFFQIFYTCILNNLWIWRLLWNNAALLYWFKRASLQNKYTCINNNYQNVLLLINLQMYNRVFQSFSLNHHSKWEFTNNIVMMLDNFRIIQLLPLYTWDFCHNWYLR